MYEELNLRAWPFQVTPDREFATIWAGREETREELARLLTKLSLAPRSSLHLMWANFGMGKTHTLYHVEHLAKARFPGLVPVYAVLPKQARGFLDVYRAIVAALPVEALGERVVAIGSTWPRDLSLHPLFGANPDVANAIVATLGQDPAKLSIARQYLAAQQGLSRSILGIIAVSSPLRTPEDASATLSVLTKLLTWDATSPRKLLLMIDEFQRIGELTARLMREISVGLHTFFNANSKGLALLLSFSFGRQDNLRFMLSDELRSRADPKTLTLDVLTPESALEFLRDLLALFRITSDPNPFAPFSEEAVRTVIEHIAGSKALTPRRLMLYFGHVLEEWLADGHPGSGLRAEAATTYLAAPDLGALDTDSPDT